MGPARGAEPGPCAGIQTKSVSPLSAVPGEVVELTGTFGERLPIKVPSVNMGNGHPMEVVRWTTERLTLRLPRRLAPGRHKIGVYCYYDGAGFSSGWLDLDVAAGAPPPDIPAPESLPTELPEDPSMLLGLGQAFWTQSRYQDCAAAYGRAAEAFKASADPQREARARSGRSLALKLMGRQEESDDEQNAAADLHWQALLAAPSDEVPRLEREYTDIGYHAAEIALRHGLHAEAERIHRIRLDIFERARDASGQATAWQGLARAAAGVKNHAEAAERFDRASALYREAGNPHGVKACDEAARAARKALGL
ncbi:MAG: hypothetical protein A2V88_01100 [Elusimicrobia bacterium RBG_16_66_12]|nr:MAG: hypothetical protein A2V88_01100 [Elusimicrobia bacterium RBG_16_66_12]